MSENTSNIDATLKSDAFDASDLSLLQKNRLLQDTVAKQKLDFADSIIETRKAQKQLETALSQCSQKDIHINNLTKDNNALQKKINSAADRIEELEKELEKYKQDHAKLQNSIIESRNETVKYRNSYLETQKKLEETQNSEHAAVINLKNSEDTVSKLKDQNDKLRGRITLGEFKEKELSDTIGKLQSENARLKKQIDSLLTGITKNITYTQEIPEAEDSTVLKPEKFVAYIPFCFPERLSTLVSFKREVRNSMRGTLTSSKSQIAFPKVFLSA